MALTREQILSRKPKRLVVEVPEWGGTVTIQALTVGTAQSITAEQGMVAIVMASAINEDGSLMFSPEDKDAVERLEFAGCKRIADAAVDFNGLSQKAVEDLAGNSATGPNGASSSG